MNGYHDMATPFFQSEQDLSRLNQGARITVRDYAGGHMSYLDDSLRVLQKADLVAFYGGTLSARSVAASAKSAPSVVKLAATPAPLPQRLIAAPAGALQTARREPWVPPSQRPVAPSQGMALQAEIESRLRAQFSAAAGAANKLTRAQAVRAGLGLVAAQFNQIDAAHTGQISFDDWRRHLRAQQSRLQ